MRTEESIDKIIAAGAVPRLIELMASGDMEVKRNSTGALANISSADRTPSANLWQRQWTWSSLIKELKHQPSSSSLARDADAKELVVEKGALPVVFDLLRSDNETVQMMAYRVITNLGDNGSFDASPSSSPSSSAQMRSAESNGEDLCTDMPCVPPENNRVEIVKAGGLKLLVDFVLKNEDESTTVEALNALCVLVENSTPASPGSGQLLASK